MSHDSTEQGIQMTGDIDWDADDSPAHDHGDDVRCHISCPAWEYKGHTCDEKFIDTVNYSVTHICNLPRGHQGSHARNP
jgi:hypothetical protein